MAEQAPAVLCLAMNPAVELATDTKRVVPKNKLRCGVPTHDAGGGGINMTRVWTQLGGAARALYPAVGLSGEWLKGRRVDEGLNATFLSTAIEAPVSFTVREQSSGAEYRFAMPGPGLSETAWRSCLHASMGLNPFLVWGLASGSLLPRVLVDF
jgi:6-phosphofructokinase 2